MRDRRFFRKLRAFFSRKKAAKKVDDDGDRSGTAAACDQPAGIADHPEQTHQPAQNTNNNKNTEMDNVDHVTGTEEMRDAADQQDLSIFFATLPLEMRRKIYHDVWRVYLKPRRMAASSPGSDLRLHVYSTNSANPRLVHTRCKRHSGDVEEKDSSVAHAWPPETYHDAPSSGPPVWFWEAWVLRLHWGRHWKCQRAVQEQWDPDAAASSGGLQLEKAPFLPLFLTCKRMSVF